MKTNRVAHLLQLALGVSFLANRGSAQTVQLPKVPLRDPQTFQQLMKNTLQLNVALTLDRQEYFPNEEVELTVAVTNTGSAPLEVFEPLYPSNGHVNIYAHDTTKTGADPRSWHRVHIDESVGLDLDAPAVWLPPAQPASKKFVTSDPSHATAVDSHGRLSETICGICVSPEDEGEYEYRYSYGRGGSVAFRVAWPQLEQWTQVRFEKNAQFQDVDPNGKWVGKMMTLPRLIRFAVLGYQNSHIIVVSVNPKTGAPPDSDPSGKLTGYVSRSFGKFRRIATTTVPITSLVATADTGENIFLTYTDQTGRSFKLKLNAKRDLEP